MSDAMQEVLNILKGTDLSSLPIDDQATLARAFAQSISIRSSADFVDPNALAACFAGTSDAFFYGRQEAPRVREFERRFAQMEGGTYALATGTGMSAIETVCNALGKGNPIVYSRNVFGTTVNLFEKQIHSLGIRTVPVDLGDLKMWEQMIDENKPSIVFLETPSNPKTELGNILEIAMIAHSYKAKLVVDSTFSSPVYQHPLDFGADVDLHSTTKYIDGHGNTLGGVVVTNDPDIREAIFGTRRMTGTIQKEFDALVCIDGLRTLEERMKTISDNAFQIAITLEHMGVPTIYLGLPSHPQYRIDQLQHRGKGVIIAFDLYTTEKALEFIHQSGLPIVANLGLHYSCISHPATTTHSRMTPEERLKAGVTDGFVRLSVGLEEPYKVLKTIESVLK